ncbi:MAG: ligase-associated DNA damage response exonuclease [Acidobacteriota bacterium]|nr:ligase-associated DNA damage response exonuclease [Acidobacteriota bacterium]
MVLRETALGLYCPEGDFFIDPWQAVPRALITHAHGDHARPGSAAYLCTPGTAALLRRRLGADTAIETISQGERIRLGSADVSFHPAGHVLGSAQIRIEGATGVWVAAGDYKRAADPTCDPFEPLRCDTFITESTFGLPIYRWDDTAAIMRDIVQWWEANRQAEKASVIFCYTLGKAQRLLAELARLTDRTVFVHGMMLGMIDAYREAGVALPEVKPVIEKTERPARAKQTSFAGELVLAPLSARGTPWMRRLGTISDAFASGLMRVRGVRRQRAYDRGFVISDHADWPDLLRTITETGASRVLATHGYAEPLARHLQSQGIESGTIRTAWEGEGAGD